jgi:hypothetical protein
MKKNILLLIVAVTTSFNVLSITLTENLLFSSKLEGSAVVPSVTTDGNGVASLMLNATRDSLSINLSFVGLSGPATSVQLFTGVEGANGSLLIDLTPAISSGKLSTLLVGANVTSNIGNLFNENIYVLVATAAYPNGEIRGQVLLETDYNFSADLSCADVVPIVVGNAYGLASFGLSGDRSKLDYKIICQGLTGPVTEVKLFYGSAGTNGSMTVDLSANINGNVIVGSFQPTATFLDSLFDHHVYLSVATAANPGGEVRSQLVHHKGISFDAFAEGTQMVPTIVTTGQAVCVIRLCPTLDTLYYDVVANGLSSVMDYAHLHVGYAGVAYGALQIDFTGTIVGNRTRGFKAGAAVSTISKRRLLISNLSLVVHTAIYPTGEIRGQVIRYAREGLTMNITGDQVVPAVTTPAFGSGLVSISRSGDDAHYMWVVGGLTSPATNAAFNLNVIGQNGTLINDLTPIIGNSGNTVKASGYWKSIDQTPFLIQQANEFLTDSVYLEIKNQDFPAGEMRGQAIHGFSYLSTTSIDQIDVDNSLKMELTPNPTNGWVQMKLTGKNTQSFSVEIIDMLGRELAQNRFEASVGEIQTHFDLSEYKTGIYIFQVNTGNTIVRERLIKQ